MSGHAVGYSDVQSAGSVVSIKFTVHTIFTVRIDDDGYKKKKGPYETHLQGEVILVIMSHEGR